MPQSDLDPLDRRIVAALQENGRAVLERTRLGLGLTVFVGV